MIPTQKLRKLVINKVVGCIQNHNNMIPEDVWTQVAELLKDEYSHTPLEIKDLYNKDILPHLNTNNYGYDELTVKILQSLGKAQKNISATSTASQDQFDKINEALEKLHNSTPGASNVFIDSNESDPLKISTKSFPRQPAPSTMEELQMLPIYEVPTETSIGPRRSENGNIQVRDEIGSSMRNNRQPYAHIDRTKASYELMCTYPMYNPETDRVERGTLYPKESIVNFQNELPLLN